MDFIERHISKKRLFGLFSGIVFIVFFQPLREWLSLSFRDDAYSHLILIPPISAYLIYSRRRRLFSGRSDAAASGIGLIAFGIILYLIAEYQGGLFVWDNYLSIMTVAMLLSWLGVYVLLFGSEALRGGYFPFLFLVFMIPMPIWMLDRIIVLLQKGSTEVAFYLFKLAGVAFEREGFVFNLPGTSIEVAKQCSGIRSTMALFITSVLAGHLFLESDWKKFILWLTVVPITILKNAIRIVVLSLLGVYVDPSFITDSLLHKRGGILFFVLALCFLGPILWYMSRSEKEQAS